MFLFNIRFITNFCSIKLCKVFIWFIRISKNYVCHITCDNFKLNWYTFLWSNMFYVLCVSVKKY